MATQPNTNAEQRERRSRILADVLARDGARLRKHARRHSYVDSDAEDAVQDACERFLCGYEGAAEDALRWLYTVIKRQAWYLGRRRREREGASLDSPAGGGDGAETIGERVASERRPTAEAAADALEAEDAMAVLATLKPDERRALVLLGLGYSYAEIAQLTGWSYTKVNRCVAEGRAFVRKGRRP